MVNNSPFPTKDVKYTLYTIHWFCVSMAFTLLFLLKEEVGLWDHHAACMSVHLMHPYQLSKQMIYFYKIWYGHCAIKGHSNVLLLNFLQPVHTHGEHINLWVGNNTSVTQSKVLIIKLGFILLIIWLALMLIRMAGWHIDSG